jgi:hypothetical protein
MCSVFMLLSKLREHIRYIIGTLAATQLVQPYTSEHPFQYRRPAHNIRTEEYSMLLA